MPGAKVMPSLAELFQEWFKKSMSIGWVSDVLTSFILKVRMAIIIIIISCKNILITKKELVAKIKI